MSIEQWTCVLALLYMLLSVVSKWLFPRSKLNYYISFMAWHIHSHILLSHRRHTLPCTLDTQWCCYCCWLYVHIVSIHLLLIEVLLCIQATEGKPFRLPSNTKIQHQRVAEHCSIEHQRQILYVCVCFNQTYGLNMVKDKTFSRLGIEAGCFVFGLHVRLATIMIVIWNGFSIREVTIVCGWTSAILNAVR